MVNKINWFIHVSAATEIYIAAFRVLQLCFNKTKYIVEIMKCNLQRKTNKNERCNLGVGDEFRLTESLGSVSVLQYTFITLHIILFATLHIF